MVVKQGFNVFWWCWWSEFALYFERPLEKWDRFKISKNFNTAYDSYKNGTESLKRIW